MSEEPSTTAWEEDPVYRNSLREAVFILGMWTVFCVYTVAYCYLYGYLSHEADPTSTGPSVAAMVGDLESFDRDPATLSYPFGLGIPDWVFWGVAVPWVLCIVLSFVYGLCLFREDDLGGVEDDAETAGGELR